MRWQLVQSYPDYHPKAEEPPVGDSCRRWMEGQCVLHLCVLRDLEEALEMGVDWSLREGYAWAEDKEHCEEYGRMLQADPNKVSSKAKKRGLPQVSSDLRKKFEREKKSF